MKRLAMIALAAFLLAGCGGKTADYSAYGDRVVCAGEWTYYASYGIYKVHNKSGERERIADDRTARSLHLSGGWLYYEAFDEADKAYDIYRVQTDGSGRQKFNVAAGIEDAIDAGMIGVYRDAVYYFLHLNHNYEAHEYPVWRMRPDGTGREMVMEEADAAYFGGQSILYLHNGDMWLYSPATGERRFILPGFVAGIREYGDSLYFVSDGKIRRANLNTGAADIFPPEAVQRLMIAGGRLWYYESGEVLSSDMDGDDHRRLMGEDELQTGTGMIELLYVAGDWLYYIPTGLDTNLHRIRLDGTGREELVIFMEHRGL
ncbi:MAG: DUF5050 domain-containing protein [Spirochaetota bacterium]|jgi:hypothetical protein|nr:DUF5050 domain-containing protein [Spirochaetota bacterium]